MKTPGWGTMLAVAGISLGFLCVAERGAARDVYIDAGGNEYAPGYQPPGSFLIHKPDAAGPAPRETQEPPVPPFRTDAKIRHEYETGAEVAVFGGLDFAQNGDFKVDYDFNPANNAAWRGSNRSHLGSLFGFKAGYTWAGFGGEGESGAGDSGFRLLPSVEYEFLYINRKYEAQGPMGGVAAGVPGTGSANFQANLDAYVITLDPVLRAQIGIFRPYVGAGIGGAYLVANHPIVSASAAVPGLGLSASGFSSGSNQEELTFAWQLMVGSDVFVTKNISLFAEYKFLNFVDPTFDVNFGPNFSKYKSEGMLSENIATAGVRYHF